MRRAGDCMHRPGRVPHDATVFEAAGEMHRLNMGAVIIEQDGRGVGLFTERDLLRRVVAAGADPRRLDVSAVMTPRFTSIPADAPVAEAAELMRRRGFRHLPVVDRGVVVGMLSLREVLDALSPPEEA